MNVRLLVRGIGFLLLFALSFSVIHASAMEKGCISCEHSKTHAHKMFLISDEEYMKWAEKYTPDKVGEWKAVLAERNQLKKRWLSPEMAAKREAFKKERHERHREMIELKKQLEDGKITREEYRKKAYEKMRNGMSRKMKGNALSLNLRIAIEKDNSQQAALSMNELLDFFRQHNEVLKMRMET
ncbi:hypothetical protein [Bacillus sp. FJAT-27445]|uniref:hypothetical protein n=1 Tax=Bacillus sp. FJAT-27445 TaxID=1679166 RepID=UPI000ADF636B|nr:hypothetical protein [Bacillus sp. FJAT-27445]